MDAAPATITSVDEFVKRRDPPAPGSIPEALGMFGAEVRFYREIAPVVGVRVPACYAAEDGPDGTRLVLEDLSGWAPGAEPVRAARLLAGLHQRWTGIAAERWPWLRRVGAAVDLVGDLFDRTWSGTRTREDVPPGVRALGDRLYGRVPELELAAVSAGPLTFVHGDATMRNLRTAPDGELAMLDWEDVGAAPGVTDLAWFLLSSVEPAGWDDVVVAYGSPVGLREALPDAACQALLSFADSPVGSTEATGWIARLDRAAQSSMVA